MPISSGNRNSAPPRPINPPRTPIAAPARKATCSRRARCSATAGIVRSGTQVTLLGGVGRPERRTGWGLVVSVAAIWPGNVITSRLTGRARGLYVVRFRGTERRRPVNFVPSLIRIVEAAIECPALFRSTIPESASSLRTPLDQTLVCLSCYGATPEPELEQVAAFTIRTLSVPEWPAGCWRVSGFWTDLSHRVPRSIGGSIQVFQL
jgi:hypothetical protein